MMRYRPGMVIFTCAAALLFQSCARWRAAKMRLFRFGRSF